MNLTPEDLATLTNVKAQIDEILTQAAAATGEGQVDDAMKAEDPKAHAEPDGDEAVTKLLDNLLSGNKAGKAKKADGEPDGDEPKEKAKKSQESPTGEDDAEARLADLPADDIEAIKEVVKAIRAKKAAAAAPDHKETTEMVKAVAKLTEIAKALNAQNQEQRALLNDLLSAHMVIEPVAKDIRGARPSMVTKSDQDRAVSEIRKLLGVGEPVEKSVSAGSAGVRDLLTGGLIDLLK